MSFQQVLAVIAICSPTMAAAVPITVLNHSFVAPGAAPRNFVGGTNFGPANWSVYNTGPTYHQRFFGAWKPAGTNSFVSGAPDGANVGVVFLQDSLNREAGLLQTLSATLQANTAYTLAVDVGNSAPNLPPIMFNFKGFPGCRVDLLAGGAVIASDNNTLVPGEGIFLKSTVSSTTGASPLNLGQQLGIRLVNLILPGPTGNPNNGIEVNFDNVRLDATNVPSPASVALFGIGLLGLAAVRRRVR